ncbi:unnamed protein product [Owenia fusiformis]|nr:unnamed protein product [Owenia fusiformis]
MKHKKINNTDDLLKFAVCSMENAGSFNIPFVKAAYEAVDEPTLPEVIDNPKMSHPSQESILRLIDLDNTCEACLSNHIANRASSRQGRSMLDTTYKATELHLLGSIQALIDENKLEGHHPVMFGYICSVLGVGKQEVIEMYMFGVLRCIVASAVRLSIIGPLQGQNIQYKLQQLVPSILKRNQKRCVEDAVITSPFIDVIQAKQDTLFSKLFYS